MERLEKMKRILKRKKKKKLKKKKKDKTDNDMKHHLILRSLSELSIPFPNTKKLKEVLI